MPLFKYLLFAVLICSFISAASAARAATVDLASFTFSGNSVIGGSTQSLAGTVTLTGPAPTDTTVLFGSSATATISTGIPTQVVVPAGQNTASFVVQPGTTSQAAVVTATASLNSIQLTASFTDLPLVISLSLSPSSIVGGSTQTGTGTVSYNAAVASNIDVTLSTSTTSTEALGIVITTNLPSSERVLAGTSSATFQYYTTSFLAQQETATITAQAVTSDTKTLTIVPENIQLSISPSKIFPTTTHSDTATAIVTVASPVRSSALVAVLNQTPVSLTFTGTSGGYLTLPAGQASATFGITASPVTQPQEGSVAARLGTTAAAPFGVEPTPPGFCAQCQARAGKPIDLTSGNTFVQQQDYSVPGAGGGLRLTRTWNSVWGVLSPPPPLGMFGKGWMSTYEERLMVSSTTPLAYWRADGSLWYFQYNSVAHAYQILAPPTARATLTFDSGTTLYTMSFPDGSSKLFNNSGYLTALVDRNGNQTSVAHDASNRITQVTNTASGQSLTFSYIDSLTNLLVSIQDATGVAATYAPNIYVGPNLSGVTYPDGSSISYAYTGSQLTSVTDKNGKVLESHTYDTSNRGLTSQKANGVELVTVSYPSGTQTQVTDSLGNNTTYGVAYVGGGGFIGSIAGPGCASCGGRNNNTYGYDSFGNVTSSTDANGNTTSYTYDPMANVLTRSNVVAGNTLTSAYTYNNFSEVLTATDPLWHVTTNTYDAKGNLLTTTTPSPDGVAAGSTTTFTYDAKGQLLTIKDPLNNLTTLAYFPSGLIQTVTDAQSHVTTYAYDGRGNRTSVTDANNKVTTFTYDLMNRLTKITYPDLTTTQFGYDIRGRRTTVTDQNGKVTTYTYDDADRLLTVKDAATNVTTYAYDTESNLTSIKDASTHTTSFAYDALQRVTKTTFPSTLSESYGYDAVGNLTSKTDRKTQTITYTYDQLNRLTGKSYPDSTAVTYTYDNASRLTQVTDPTGTYAFTFDNMGRLTNTTTSYAFLTGRNFTTSYGYDAASNRTSFTDPESGSTAYAYDSLNRLSTLTPPSAFTTGSFGFSYDALSRRTQMTRPNGVSTLYAYDNLSRLTSALHQLAGSTIDGATYTVDNAGNRTSRMPLPSGTASNFAYDSIYQLTGVTQGASSTETYSYDAVGNRLSSLGVSPYAYNSSNELTSKPGVTFTYDLNGNTLTKADSTGTTSYAWDFENRLTSVTLPGSGGTVTFKYDPFGRRIYKSSSSGTSIYAYDGDNSIEETNSSGAAVARYAQTTNLDEPLAMLRGGATSFYQTDGLGSISSLTNASGAVAQTYTYDSFGKATASSGTLTNPFQFTAREFDAESGLYFLRNRYYDPQSGRFLNEDPLGFGGDDANFYAYVQNSPVDSVDPFGLQHKPGGPWHPDPWVKFACKWTDSCAALSTKIGIFKSLVAGHLAWDIANNQPGRHSDDIATFTNGLANCIAIHKAKCTNKQCPPEDTPVPVPVPAPQREPFRVPVPSPAVGQAAAKAGIAIIILRILFALAAAAA